jgi:hypothetical protein
MKSFFKSIRIIENYLKHFDYKEESLSEYNLSFLNPETIMAEVVSPIQDEVIDEIVRNWWVTKSFITTEDVEELIISMKKGLHG